MKRLTIKDVAKHANVSIATVSRVINDHHWTSEDARKKVRKAIEELGYEPNALARGLVSRKSNSIGVLIPDISNLFSAEVFRGIEDAVHERGSNVFICNTDRDQSRMLRYLRFLREKQVEGIIFTSEEVTKEYDEAFQQSKVPIVLIATESKKYPLPAVKVNDQQAVKDAILYLYGKGHTEIGMISGPIDDRIAGEPRYSGYIAALKEIGLSYQNENVVFGEFHFDSGRKALRELLEKNNRITAVFASSDEMAVGAIVEASKMGLKLPKELSIMGYDDIRIAQMSNPPLTTLSQSIYEMGYQGAELLFDFIDQYQQTGKLAFPNKTIFVPHTIVERESVQPIAKK